MGRFPCLGAFEAQKPRQVAKKWQGNRHVFSISNPPSKVRNGNGGDVRKRGLRGLCDRLKGDGKTSFALLSRPTWGLLGLRRCRFVERRLGMDSADELNLGGQVRQDASTSIGAVAEDDDLIVGEPSGRQIDELEAQLRSRAMR